MLVIDASRSGLVLMGAVALAVVCVALPASSLAVPITLSDVNSQLVIDPTSPAGMNSWVVDGVNHLTQQWFWYRAGPMGMEESVSTLQLVSAVLSDGDLDPGHERLAVTYAGLGFTLQLDLTLTGGAVGSGASDLLEVISFQKTGQEDLEFHFFQYADFDLNGDALDDSVAITGGNTAQQSDGNVISESVVTGPPDHHQVDVFSNILDALNDSDVDDLNDASGPVRDDNLTWAFQWDFTLGDDGVIISKNKNLVPEPGALTVLVAGTLLTLLRRKRR